MVADTEDLKTKLEGVREVHIIDTGYYLQLASGHLWALQAEYERSGFGEYYPDDVLEVVPERVKHEYKRILEGRKRDEHGILVVHPEYNLFKRSIDQALVTSEDEMHANLSDRSKSLWKKAWVDILTEDNGYLLPHKRLSKTDYVVFELALGFGSFGKQTVVYTTDIRIDRVLKRLSEKFQLHNLKTCSPDEMPPQQRIIDALSIDPILGEVAISKLFKLRPSGRISHYLLMAKNLKVGGDVVTDLGFDVVEDCRGYPDNVYTLPLCVYGEGKRIPLLSIPHRDALLVTPEDHTIQRAKYSPTYNLEGGKLVRAHTNIALDLTIGKNFWARVENAYLRHHAPETLAFIKGLLKN